MPGAARPYGHRRRRRAEGDPQGAVGASERPRRRFAGNGDPAGESLRQHGRALARNADAVRPVAGAKEGGRHQGPPHGQSRLKNPFPPSSGGAYAPPATSPAPAGAENVVPCHSRPRIA